MRLSRILIDLHPNFRMMYLPGGDWCRPWCGDCSYYGWRWWVGFGPVLLLIGQAKQ